MQAWLVVVLGASEFFGDSWLAAVGMIAKSAAWIASAEDAAHSAAVRDYCAEAAALF